MPCRAEGDIVSSFGCTKQNFQWTNAQSFQQVAKDGREAFLKCTSLREVRTPPTLLYIALRAATLHIAQNRKENDLEEPYAKANAFDKCGQLDIPKWIHFLLSNTNCGCDMWADDFYEELRKDLH